MIGFLGASFFVILAPTSIMPGRVQMIVEHRIYLPLAAVMTLFAIGIRAMLEAAVRLKPDDPSAQQALAAALQQAGGY